jgi:hypothetical protein
MSTLSVVRALYSMLKFEGLDAADLIGLAGMIHWMIRVTNHVA